jgi:peptidoglycan/LPS O-acetylase OafA/YrhL
LDGIRGVFCILIIINHWKLVLPISPIGWEVLQTFFVMSGYLISRILLNDREKHGSFKGYIKSFYIKRSLRIFPLYFIYIIFWGVMRLVFYDSYFIRTNTQELADHWILYMTYTSNFKALADFTAQDTPFFAHLWSMGLEEQFYLIMPFLIFFLRGKWLKRALIIVILLPFLTRTLGQHLLTQLNDNDIWASILIYRNLPFQMDSFAFGAALAVFNWDWLKHPKRWLGFFFAIFCVLTAYHYTLINDFAPVLLQYLKDIYFLDLTTIPHVNLFVYFDLLGHPELLPMGRQYIYMMPLVNTMVFLLILTCIRGEPPFSRLFHYKPLIEIGKVTYGMYVFHYCLIVIMLKGISMVIGRSAGSINILWHIPIFIVYLTVLYYLSRFSFKYIEAPFLKIKNRVK